MEALDLHFLPRGSSVGLFTFSRIETSCVRLVEKRIDPLLLWIHVVCVCFVRVRSGLFGREVAFAIGFVE
jgi:hypothetical protein